MTEQTDAAEVEALRALLAALRYGSHTFTTHEMAERILASDLLAAREAAARAEGARAVVEAVEAAYGTPPPVGSRALDMLEAARDRADSIARTDGAGS